MFGVARIDLDENKGKISQPASQDVDNFPASGYHEIKRIKS
jgi:hypothetical protein